MVANLTQIQSPLNFLLKEILIFYCRSQVYELCHIYKTSVNYLYVMILSILVRIQQHIGKHMTNDRQRLGKHVPEVTPSKIEGCPVLGKKRVPWTETESTHVYAATN
jgi:hypothetical protein